MSAVLQDVGQIDRQAYLGGGDIAGILGVSPWQSRVSVWQKKVEPRDESAPRPAKKKLFNRGKLWEKVVGEMLEAKLVDQGHKVQVLSANHRYVDPDVPYFAAEIDYEILLDDIPDIVNVELKTVHPNATREWGEEDTDECPLHYAAQAAWGLGITRRNCCIVAPLFGADEIRAYPIVRDDVTIQGMREQARNFWELYVLPKKAPEPLSLADVDRLFKRDAERQVLADPEIVEKLLRLRAVESELDARTLERDVLEFQVKRFMGDATALMLPGQEKSAATWKMRANAHLDQTSFKADYPKLYKQYLRTGQSRFFEVKQFKTRGVNA
jgi:putative phage-type endonuclease